MACSREPAADGSRSLWPVVVPDAVKPPLPRGGLPASCRTLPAPDSVAHWERQSALLTAYDDVHGVPMRTASARATLIARRTLASVTLDSFAQRPQALAEFDLDQPHNKLRPGRYCLVLTYDPAVPGTAGVNDRRRWQMYLDDLRAPAASAAAWVPFISRRDASNDPAGHPVGAPMPDPPVRFDFPLRSELPAENRSRGVSPRARYESPAWLVTSAWGWCAGGCCTGGVEALETY